MTAPLHRASQMKLEIQTVKEKEEKQQAKETAIVSFECPRDVAEQHTTKTKFVTVLRKWRKVTSLL
jgi:hypothetical protein